MLGAPYPFKFNTVYLGIADFAGIMRFMGITSIMGIMDFICNVDFMDFMGPMGIKEIR